MHAFTGGPSGTRRTTGITPPFTALFADITSVIRSIPPIMKTTPVNNDLYRVLSHSEGVMTRVRMINATLRHLRIDCSELDSLAGIGASQLITVQAMVRAGNRPGTRTSLSQFRETVTSLRNAYRAVLVREDLPGETAHGVLSVAQSLDVTAVQAGIA
jgi:hypothetical protein